MPDLQLATADRLTVRHFAWFDRASGQWLGEWRGGVPAPSIPPEVIGDLRLRLMNRWQQSVVRRISPDGADGLAGLEDLWDRPAWDACPPGGAVCLDVTHFGWPVGDHVWHHWDDAAQFLDWSEPHLFLEVDRVSRAIVANTASSRPIRSTPARALIDITGTPFEAWHGRLLGTADDLAHILTRRQVKELYGETHQS